MAEEFPPFPGCRSSIRIPFCVLRSKIDRAWKQLFYLFRASSLCRASLLVAMRSCRLRSIYFTALLVMEDWIAGEVNKNKRRIFGGIREDTGNDERNIRSTNGKMKL